jgi:predicted porin
MGAGAAYGATTFDGRQSNVVAYISPNLNGFTFAAAYVAGAENAYDTTAAGNHNKGDAWSVMGNYSNGPWYGALAYERHNVGSAGTGGLGFGVADLSDREEHAWKIGGGYKANNFRVGLEYEDTKDDFGDGTDPLGCGQSSCFGHHAWNLGAGYTFGNNEVKFQYTQTGDLDSVSNSSAKQYTLGIDHNFSKRTKIFALYTKLDNDDNAAYSLIGASNGGVNNNPLTTAGNGFGSDPSAFSIGMAHSF